MKFMLLDKHTSVKLDLLIEGNILTESVYEQQAEEII
jgi:hypothetical protein